MFSNVQIKTTIKLKENTKINSGPLAQVENHQLKEAIIKYYIGDRNEKIKKAIKCFMIHHALHNNYYNIL